MTVEIIAEIGINHSGDIEKAKDLIRMSKACGANFVKFQKRTVNIIWTPEEQAKLRDSGITQGEQKRGLEFGEEGYEEIDLFCKNIGIPWFASCWDLDSLAFIEKFKPPRHKIASAMIEYKELLEAVAKLKRLTYISTGMAEDCVVDKAVSIFKYYECPFVLMHCIAEYPCPPERSNLKKIYKLRTRYPHIPIGFSSHAVSPIVAAFAVCYEAVAVEAHITLDRSSPGSDQAASLERHGLEYLVDYCRLAEITRGDGETHVTEKEKANAKKLMWYKRG